MSDGRLVDLQAEAEKRMQLARDLGEFQAWQNKAVKRGWKLPGNSPLPNLGHGDD